MNMKQKYTNTKESGDEKNEIGSPIIINYDFTEHQFIDELYSTSDIVSALGGIAASIKLFTGVITTVLILSYIIALAKVYHRKYQYKYQKSEMYKMMKYFDELMVKENKENFSPADLKKMEKIL